MPDESIPFDDRGYAYGDGLFETVLVRDGHPLLWDAHMARLQDGCRRLGIACPPLAEIERLPAHAGSGLHVLKLVLTRGSGGRGYLPPAEPEARLRWRITPFTPRARHWQGVKVRLCELRLGIQPRLAGIKHLNRLENVLARQEWQDESIAEGLLCDSEGRLIEATAMNVFWLREGQLETPRLDCCGVAGTLRAALLECLPISEVSRGVDVLDEIQALWLGNSVQGVWPVGYVEDAKGRLISNWRLPTGHDAFQDTAQQLLGYPRQG